MTLTHGVLTDGKLYYSLTRNDGKHQLRTVSFDSIQDIPTILNLALAHNLHTIWIAPGDRINFFNTVHAADPDNQWEMKISLTKAPVRGAPDVIRGISARRNVGNWQEKRLITITMPQWTPYAWDLANIPELTDPVACLGALHYLERALQLDNPLHHNPGIMGRQLIAETNSEHSRPNWIIAPTDNLAKLETEIGYDMAYNAGIDPTDLMTGALKWLHAWDKNSMYLGACSSVELGTGNPVYVNPNELAADYEGTLARFYDGKRPGYWHIAYDFLDIPPALNGLYEGQEWITTPLLKYLWAMGAKIRIREAYIWLEHHRILDDFATRLWNARESLKKDSHIYPNPRARAIAYYSIKRIATASIGLLANRDAARFSPQFYRPDWRATIIEEAKVRLLYKVAQIQRLYDTWPVAIATDCLYYLLPCANPYGAFVANGKDLLAPGGLGAWKIAHNSLPASYSVLECFAPGLSAGTAARRIKQLAKQSISEGGII